MHQLNPLHVDGVFDTSPAFAKTRLGACAWGLRPVLRLCLGLSTGVLHVLPNGHSRFAAAMGDLAVAGTYQSVENACVSVARQFIGPWAGIVGVGHVSCAMA